jgi:two-component system sensor histidine kinase KdpD
MVEYRGTRLPEMDVDAVLARAPQTALVDEYAHTNAPGSRHAKRWEDVDELLDAGIDVLTTVNVQHLASLNDVVESITGTRQQEVVPDAIVRRADQIELVDIPPELLRQRLGAGLVYAPDKIDAAMANYFRLGNLAALREIALIWLADRVEEGLAEYRKRHRIDQTWPARERVVVALTGGPEGEALIRRAARILSRVSGGDLLAVHVRTPDGLAEGTEQDLAVQRKLVEDLGGSYQQLAGDDIATSLLDYARSINATQIVVGVSRHTRLQQLLGRGGVGAAVVRGSGEIDVHMVTHPLVGRRPRLRLTPLLGRTRTLVGYALAFLVPILMTAALLPFPQLNLTTLALAHLCGVVVVAFIGGLWPAVVAAVVDSLLLNFFFTTPVGTLTVDDPQNFFALVVFLAVAVAFSLVVGVSSSRSQEAAVARAEAGTLSELASGSLARDQSAEDFLEQLRAEFQLGAVSLLRESEGTWKVDSSAGPDAPASPDDGDGADPLGGGLTLAWKGRALSGSERRLMAAFEAHLTALLERQQLTLSLGETVRLGEANRIRTSILRAVSHDLRTPLAGIRLAATALKRQRGKTTPEEQAEMLEAIDAYSNRLEALVANLLDMSRIDSAAVSVLHEPVTWLDVVSEALAELPPEAVRVDLAPNLPALDGDRGLLERALANIVGNAVKYAPGSGIVVVATTGGLVAPGIGDRPVSELRVIDHGKGVPAERVVAMFQPFQRLGDEGNGPGIGLGLAVAKGFIEAMDGELAAEPTPGGGLTMVIRMPLYSGPRD